MRFPAVFVLLLLFLSLTAKSQIPVFERTYDHHNDDFGLDLEETASGYLLLSSVGYTATSSWDPVLTATDPSGNVLWSKSYQLNPAYFFRAAKGELRRAGNGYTAMGFASPLTSTSHLSLFLFHTGLTGNPLWSRVYDFPLLKETGDFQPTSDGGYIICGTWCDTALAVARQPLLLKTDGNGIPQWCYRYDSASVISKSGYTGVAESPNGGYIVAGTKNTRLTLFRFDSGGAFLWWKEYFPSSGEQKVLAQADGFIVLSQSGAGPVLMKTDTSGNPLWVKNYLDTAWVISMTELQQSPDSGFVLGGTAIHNTNGKQSAAMCKTGAAGQLQWMRSYAAPAWGNWTAGLRAGSAGGLVALGASYEDSWQTHQDLYLLHTDFAGSTVCSDSAIAAVAQPLSVFPVQGGSSQVAMSCLLPVSVGDTALSFIDSVYCATTGITERPAESGLTVYPNPAATSLTVSRPGGQQEDLLLFSSTGALVMQRSIPRQQELFTFDISALPPGLYLLRIGRYGQRLLVVR